MVDDDDDDDADTTVLRVSLNQGAPHNLQKGEVDLGLVHEWVHGLLRTRGTDAFRMKGVLAVAHSEQRLICAVSKTLNATFAEAWRDDEARESRLVFTGRDLDAAALAAGFNACLTTPENLARKAAALRFAIGDEVECHELRCGVEHNVSHGRAEWAAGTVVALLYRDAGMPPGTVAPYQVRLAADRLEGVRDRLIFVPADHDSIVRRSTRGGDGAASGARGGDGDGRAAAAPAQDPMDPVAQAMELEKVRRELMELPIAEVAGMLEEMGLPQEGDKTELVDRLIRHTLAREDPASEESRHERELEDVRRRLLALSHEKLLEMTRELGLPHEGSTEELVLRLVNNARAIRTRAKERSAAGFSKG